MMCCLGTLIIAFTSYAVADLDACYEGRIQLKRDPVDRLLQELNHLLQTFDQKGLGDTSRKMRGMTLTGGWENAVDMGQKVVPES
jgi:hypothetical protein